MDTKRKSTKKDATDIPSELQKEAEETTDPACEDLTDKIMAHLPHLVDEIKASDADVRVEGVRWEETDRTRQQVRTGQNRFSGYSPDVIDFLRRCTTQDEALEIINFLEKRGEINTNHAEELRKQLRNHGLHSFGAKKTWGHYERETT